MTNAHSRRLFLKGALGGAAVAATGGRALAQEAAFPPPGMMAQESHLLGPGPGVALLSRNENPYGPSPSALKMIDYAAKKGAYYAGGEAYGKLASMIAERHGVDSDQVVITSGSGEALCAIALAYGQDGPIVAPRLFWDTTALYAANLGMASIDRVPLTGDMDIDYAGIEAKVTEDTGLVQLCNPNNPTGLVTGPDVLKPVVKRLAAKTTVLVDEAYIELADNEDAITCVDLIKEGHDVIVSRTFSKIYGMAGIRVGYTISSAEAAQKIRSTAMSWIAGTGLAAAIGCYNDQQFIDYSKARIVEGREMVQDVVGSLGLVSLPSSTNFVYFKSGKEANDVRAAMEAKKISIRGQYMDYNEWTRVSMGTLEDVTRFCKALPEVIEA